VRWPQLFDRQARLSNTCKGIASPFFQSGDDVITSARPEPAVNHVREICFLFTKRLGNLCETGEPAMDRWLEYDLVVLAMLVLGIALVEFLALSF
jgi:hypothetical protein